MDDTKNALAELAEELESLIPKDKDIRELDQRRWNAVNKAQRIVAELAKVPFASYCYESYGNAACALLKCRAIVEEGEIERTSLHFRD